MRVRGQVVVITGGAGGIGAALARRFAAEGAAGILVADLDGEGAARVAAEVSAAGVPALARRTDVTVEAEVAATVAAAGQRFGPVDLMCSNAGIASGLGLEAGDEDWSRAWSVNVMAHVYAARAVVPDMVRRGGGYLLQTCSAAGLLTSVGDAPYAASKHAAVAFAEWLSITYGHAGVRVSALCPQGVRTAMISEGLAEGHPAVAAMRASEEILEPDRVADEVVEGLAAERFLILPHPQVADYERHRTADRDRWIAAMRRFGGLDHPSGEDLLGDSRH
jgi:NAD(P)-dependent dehydrogenase (short-subunit alcohol dehydrogenase family)